MVLGLFPLLSLFGVPVSETVITLNLLPRLLVRFWRFFHLGKMQKFIKLTLFHSLLLSFHLPLSLPRQIFQLCFSIKDSLAVL